MYNTVKFFIDGRLAIGRTLVEDNIVGNVFSLRVLTFFVLKSQILSILFLLYILLNGGAIRRRRNEWLCSVLIDD